MKVKKKQLLLYAITDRSWLHGESLSSQVKLALEGGATMIQLREKGEKEREETLKIQQLCREYQVPFIINDDVRLAKEIDADGVHIGQDDMEMSEARRILGEDKIIGVTAKTIEQAKKAEAAGADYLGSGAVFGSSTKKDAKPMEHALLQEICESVSIPVVAIGGIDASNMAQLAGRKMSGFAVVSGIFAQPDIRQATENLYRIARATVGKHTALTIAGSDCSGGAGIQADLKTMIANGVYGMSAITALTAQNTTGVTGIMEVTPEFLAKQLDAIFTDITPEAVKIGMLSNADLITTIVEKLKKYDAKNIVVDPVMVATSGAKLISDDAIAVLKKELLPIATLITPNIPEAEVLAERAITTAEDMCLAAKEISEKYQCNVLLKGGHQLNDANDYLYLRGEEPVWFEGKRIANTNTHGTGCTLSSAIASNLAKEDTLQEAVAHAKEYISGALAAMLNLGKGSGPMDHGYVLDLLEKEL